MARLIADTFNKAGIRADPTPWRRCATQLGNDREVTRRELEKLELYAAGSKRLTREDVLTLCADNAALVLDEIVDAIGTGHAGRARRGARTARSPRPSIRSRSWPRCAQPFRAPAALADARSMPASRRRRRARWRARPKPHFSRRASTGAAACGSGRTTASRSARRAPAHANGCQPDPQARPRGDRRRAKAFARIVAGHR